MHLIYDTIAIMLEILIWHYIRGVFSFLKTGRRPVLFIVIFDFRLWRQCRKAFYYFNMKEKSRGQLLYGHF